MTINTIVNGGMTKDGTKFPGLVPLVHRYISELEDVDIETHCTVTRYLKLISDRAAGTTVQIFTDFRISFVISKVLDHVFLLNFKEF